MGQNLLQYTSWHSTTHGGRPPDSHLFFYAASSQFDRVKLRCGDTIWHVSVVPPGRGQPPQLVLCGRLVPECVTNDQSKVREWTDGYVYPAKWHALRHKDTAEPYRAIDIDDLSPQLRFESRHDRLRLVDGPPLGQQLQRIRRLTPDSVELLSLRWEEHHPPAGATVAK